MRSDQIKSPGSAWKWKYFMRFETVPDRKRRKVTKSQALLERTR